MIVIKWIKRITITFTLMYTGYLFVPYFLGAKRIDFTEGVILFVLMFASIISARVHLELVKKDNNQYKGTGW